MITDISLAASALGIALPELKWLLATGQFLPRFGLNGEEEYDLSDANLDDEEESSNDEAV